jgi:hypothetical protein
MNTDPLEWWAANEINFPALSVMARQYLGVPATSASAERLMMIVLLLFLQKQSLAFAVYLFGIGTLHTGPG